MAELITLDIDTPSVQYLCKKDARLKKIISMVGPITYPKQEEAPYCFIVHQIINQMLSVKAGERIFERLKEMCGGEITPEKILPLSEEEIRSAGISSSKTRYIKGITDSVARGELVFSELENMDDKEAMKKLTSFRGIGNWTAKMYLLFVAGRQDILPYEDMTFVQAYKWAYKPNDITPKAIIKKCEKWKPYSGVAARFLYRALDTGLTQEEFHLFK